MSILQGILGVDVGDVLGVGIPAALQVFQGQNALQIAQLNLRAQQATEARTVASQKAANNQVRLLVTGGLVLFGTVLAIRALRK